MSARKVIVTTTRIVRALPSLAYAIGLHAKALAMAIVLAIGEALEDE